MKQSPWQPPVISIVGCKKSGKTGLVSSMIRWFSSRGYCVGAVRHSPHEHLIDSVGSDTEKFRSAGAACSALVALHQSTMFFSVKTWKEKIALIHHTFSDCHIVFMEGGIRNARHKIEIVPGGKQPLCSEDSELKAFVGRGIVSTSVPCFDPDDIEGVCSFIESSYLLPSVSGAVLAGGMSSRMGTNKAFLEIAGEPVINRVVKTINPFVCGVKIITSSPGDYECLGLDAVPDKYPGYGPLSGIHTALLLSSTEYVFVLSCDIPLISATHIKRLIGKYPGADITIYKHKNFEPLCAIYNRRCIDALEELIRFGECRIIDLFPTLNVRVVRTDDADAFRSINTREDYEYVLKSLSLRGEGVNCDQTL